MVDGAVLTVLVGVEGVVVVPCHNRRMGVAGGVGGAAGHGVVMIAAGAAVWPHGRRNTGFVVVVGAGAGFASGVGGVGGEGLTADDVVTGVTTGNMLSRLGSGDTALTGTGDGSGAAIA